MGRVDQESYMSYKFESCHQPQIFNKNNIVNMKYIFRDLVILEYNPEIKEVILYPEEFKLCKLIPEDYLLIALFFNRIYLHQNNVEGSLQDIIVG